MHKIYASTGAFIGRANGRDFYKLKEIAPRIDCDGFELMFYADWYEKTGELVRFLNSLPCEFPTFHCDKQIGVLLAEEKTAAALDHFEINCRAARDIGAKLAVLHLWNGPISDSNIEANFSAYPYLEEIADKYEITLTAENVLAYVNTPLTLLLELHRHSPSAFFTYDTKMADFDNENIVAFDDKYIPLWTNVRHIHLNDRAGAYRDWDSIRALHLGAGQVDFEAFFRGLSRVGYLGDFTVEAASLESDGTVRSGLMNESLAKLRGYLGRMQDK